MKYETKIQSVAGSLTTTIPAFVRDFMDVTKGEKLEWTIDTETGSVTVTKKE